MIKWREWPIRMILAGSPTKYTWQYYTLIGIAAGICLIVIGNACSMRDMVCACPHSAAIRPISDATALMEGVVLMGCMLSMIWRGSVYAGLRLLAYAVVVPVIVIAINHH